MLMDKNICKKCQKQKFKPSGVALTRGLKFFVCEFCGRSSVNYANGQSTLCHECAIKTDRCVMCGSKITYG